MLIECLGLERSKVVSLCGAGGKTSLMFALAREMAARGERVLVTTTTKIAIDEARHFASFAAGNAAEVLARAGRSADRAVIAYGKAAPDGERLMGFAPELIDELAQSCELDRILIEADGSRRKPLKAPDAHEPVIPRTTDALIIVAGLNGIGMPLAEDNVFRADIWARLTGMELGAAISGESLARAVVHADGLARTCPANARKLLFLNRAESRRDFVAANEVVEWLHGFCGLERVVCGRLLPQPRVRMLWQKSGPADR